MYIIILLSRDKIFVSANDRTEKKKKNRKSAIAYTAKYEVILTFLPRRFHSSVVIHTFIEVGDDLGTICVTNFHENEEGGEGRG